MKQFMVIWTRLVCLIFLLGVRLVEASEQSQEAHQWIAYIDSAEHFRADFPYQPTHMRFKLSKEDALIGSLHVYSTSLAKGVLMINVISSSSLEGQELKEDFFKKVFYSCFARRLFYQPKEFKKYATFEFRESQFEGYPALQFSALYPNDSVKKMIFGTAILKVNKLYTIFCIAPETDSEIKLFDQFIHSFHFESSPSNKKEYNP